MRTPSIPNLSLIPAVIGALLQAGAQLFAIAVVVGTVTEAPPRSLAMYAGDYGYDSGPFWEVTRRSASRQCAGTCSIGSLGR